MFATISITSAVPKLWDSRRFYSTHYFNGALFARVFSAVFIYSVVKSENVICSAMQLELDRKLKKKLSENWISCFCVLWLQLQTDKRAAAACSHGNIFWRLPVKRRLCSVNIISIQPKTIRLSRLVTNNLNFWYWIIWNVKVFSNNCTTELEIIFRYNFCYRCIT